MAVRCMAGVAFLLFMAFLSCQRAPPVWAAGPDTELQAGTAYQWAHDQRPGLEAWQYYVVCDDLSSAKAFTNEIAASVETHERESGHALGAHLDFAFPSHLACEKRASVAFTPWAEQPTEAVSTLGFGMVYLPAGEIERATHICAERPCALAPVMRQFIQVDVEGDVIKPGAWLRVGFAIKVTNKGAP